MLQPSNMQHTRLAPAEDPSITTHRAVFPSSEDHCSIEPTRPRWLVACSHNTVVCQQHHCCCRLRDIHCTPHAHLCRCDPDQPYSLAACGHTYCTSCVEALLSSATRNNDFPVSCCANSCCCRVSLADLGQLLPAAQLSDAFKAAFRAFVTDRHEEWGCCLSADCPQVLDGCCAVPCSLASSWFSQGLACTTTTHDVFPRW